MSSKGTIKTPNPVDLHQKSSLDQIHALLSTVQKHSAAGIFFSYVMIIKYVFLFHALFQ